MAAVLIAAGVFWTGGLDLGNGKDDNIDLARPLLVVVVSLVAVACFVFREWSLIQSWRTALWWVGLTLAYLGVGWIVLNPAAASWMSMRTQQAQARGLGVLTVIFFLIAAALYLKLAAASDAPKSLTSILKLSTSPGSTVIMLWSLVIAYALGVIAGTVVLANNADAIKSPDEDHSFTCTGTNTENCVTEGVWPGYLILLGLPGAAAVATAAQKGPTGSRQSVPAAQTMLAELKSKGSEKIVQLEADDQKSTDVEADQVAPNKKIREEFLASLIPDPPAVPDTPANTTSAISDIQYFVFNIFAMGYVLATLIPYGRLPAIPDIVLGLTGVSALVYAMNGQLNQPSTRGGD